MLFHTLKGVRAWSNFYCQKVDVARVIETEQRRRLFKIFQYDHDYSLTIKYRETTIESDVAPTIGTGSHGMVVGTTFVDKVKKVQIITLRYKNIKDMQDDVQEIEDKQSRLRRFVERQFKDVV